MRRLLSLKNLTFAGLKYGDHYTWERGLNEHTSGLVRQYFPKATNLKLARESKIAQIETLLHNRPGKVLGYKTPKEVFMSALNATEKIALQG